MDATFIGKIKETSIMPDKPFGFLVQREKYKEVRITPLFPGDDHWDLEYSNDKLFLTTFDDEIKKQILGLEIGHSIEVKFNIISKEYSNLRYTFLNPLSIKILDSTVDD